jgi:hypothetical protein
MPSPVPFPSPRTRRQTSGSATPPPSRCQRQWRAQEAGESGLVFTGPQSASIRKGDGIGRGRPSPQQRSVPLACKLTGGAGQPRTALLKPHPWPVVITQITPQPISRRRWQPQESLQSRVPRRFCASTRSLLGNQVARCMKGTSNSCRRRGVRSRLLPRVARLRPLPPGKPRRLTACGWRTRLVLEPIACRPWLAVAAGRLLAGCAAFQTP